MAIHIADPITLTGSASLIVSASHVYSLVPERMKGTATLSTQATVTYTTSVVMTGTATVSASDVYHYLPTTFETHIAYLDLKRDTNPCACCHACACYNPNHGSRYSPSNSLNRDYLKYSMHDTEDWLHLPEIVDTLVRKAVVVVGRANQVHIAYVQWNKNLIHAWKPYNGTWQYEVLDTESDVADLDLIEDEHGGLHLIYHDLAQYSKSVQDKQLKRLSEAILYLQGTSNLPTWAATQQDVHDTLTLLMDKMLDYDREKLKYIAWNGAWDGCLNWNGTWGTTNIVDMEGFVGHAPAIALNGDDPVAVYGDYTNQNYKIAELLTDPNTLIRDWAKSFITNTVSNYNKDASVLSVAIHNGNTHVVISTGLSTDYMIRDSSSVWHYLGELPKDSYNYTLAFKQSLAIGTDGYAHVVYVSLNIGGTYELTHAYAHITGTALGPWIRRVIHTNNVGYDSASIKLDEFDRPHVLYHMKNDNDLRYSKYDGRYWNTSNIERPQTSMVMKGSSMALYGAAPRAFMQGTANMKVSAGVVLDSNAISIQGHSIITCTGVKQVLGGASLLSTATLNVEATLIPKDKVQGLNGYDFTLGFPLPSIILGL